MNFKNSLKIVLLGSVIALTSACSFFQERTPEQVLAQKGIEEYKAYLKDNKAVLNRQAKIYYNIGQPYKKYIEEVAKEKSLSSEIYALAAIESGFKETAISFNKNNVGLWQIKKETALYNMKMVVNDRVDERKDWKKSTEAALNYISNESSKYFNNNENLAILSYHTGAAKVIRAIKNNNTSDFWIIIQDKHCFSKYEREYMFKYLAFVKEFKDLDKKIIR